MTTPDVRDWARRHALEARTAATIRALSRQPRVHFEAGRPWNGDTLLPDGAPHLQTQPGLDDPPAYRALADALALRLLRSDARLHQDRISLLDPVAALIFEWLEQWRVEALAPERWPGMRDNLRRRFEQWLFRFQGSGLIETRTGQHLFCLALMARGRLFDEPVPERLEDLIESARYRMGPLLAGPLARLRLLREDQAAYAPVAAELATALARWFQDLAGKEKKRPPKRHLDFSVALLPPGIDEDEAAGQAAGGSPAGEAAGSGYAVWTRRHDRVVEAASLVRPALLRDYRRRLDEEVARLPWSLSRLAQALRRMLFRPQPSGRLFGQDEGWIDGRRLAQLIGSPDDHRVFFRERDEPVAQARIALLLDCSGSMRHHGPRLALLMDLLARVFGRADVPFELLGFTTGAWNGGRPAREWQAARGRPEHPGRLNELQHVVFWSQAMPRRQGRLGLTAAMKPELFREGIDGEAVQWACERLLAQRDERRRILWVVSDGGPMDSATALANPPGFLDAHLRQVVRHYTRERGVEILAVGVNQDLSAYYPHSIGLDLDGGVTMQALLALIRTLAPRRRRP
ncbi:cobaltochelatase CobT-related protein [Castellaniella denitrificans]|uniref:cobaltochelatase CobT-related protein n=1 Tax=Castellaniella denitrificans TaxID=56119 RepID=UPI0036179006